jgi:hypothetical protein
VGDVNLNKDEAELVDDDGKGEIMYWMIGMIGNIRCMVGRKFGQCTLENMQQYRQLMETQLEWGHLAVDKMVWYQCSPLLFVRTKGKIVCMLKYIM